MTTTQAPPTDEQTVVAPTPLTGLAGILGSTDHTLIGRLFLLFSGVFGLATACAGVIAALARIDGDLTNNILTSETAGQVVAFHAGGLVLLCLMPALLGVAMIVVPAQIGANAVAFPRAAAASLWGYAMAAALSCAAFAINGGPGGGETRGVDLWIVASIVLLASLLLGAVNIATTVIVGRAEDVSLADVGLFAYSFMCSAAIWLLTLPVGIALLIVLYVDHHGPQVGVGASGPAMYNQIGWISKQPQVFALAIPVLGLLLDGAKALTPAQKGVGRLLIGLFSACSLGAVTVGTASASAHQPVLRAMLILAVLPVLAALGLVAASLRTAKPTAALGTGVIAALALLLATVTGALYPFQSLLSLAGTQWEAAQTHFTLGAVLIAILVAVINWAPEIFGHELNAKTALPGVALAALGTLLVAVPEALSGLTGEGSEAVSGVEGLNAVTVAGAGAIGLGVVVVLLALMASSRGAAQEVEA